MIIKEGDSTNDEETIKAVIPKGFYYVTGKPSTGLVISDKIGDDDNNSKGGNQFVWVPCNGNSGVRYERTKDKSTKFGLASQWTDKTKQGDYNKPKEYTDWTDYGGAKDGDTIDSVDSVQKYGGFYVARFEAGVPENAGFYANSNGDSYQINKNDTKLKPVSKKNNQCWNYINQFNAKIVSQNMYENSSAVSSQLIDSFAWDTIISWLKQDDANIGKDSTTYGNYRNSSGIIKDTLYSIHKYIEQKDQNKWINYNPGKKYYKGNINLGRKILSEEDEKKYEFYTSDIEYDFEKYYHYALIEIATGNYKSEDKDSKSNIKNIYDMAGNMWEWTTEVGNHSTSETKILQENINKATCAVIRGGGFDSKGFDFSVAFRNGSYSSNSSNYNVGFRVVLYLNCI